MGEYDERTELSSRLSKPGREESVSYGKAQLRHGLQGLSNDRARADHQGGICEDFASKTLGPTNRPALIDHNESARDAGDAGMHFSCSTVSFPFSR
jgi:hypothetical protein